MDCGGQLNIYIWEKKGFTKKKHQCLITVEYKAWNFSTRGALLFTKECVCTIMNVVVSVINYLA